MKRVSTSAVGLVLLIVQLAVLVSIPRGVSAYTFHTPIYIDGNGGFNASNGVTGGSGLPGDPYVIEGWDINSTGTGGMGIENTDAHFVIRNVYVHSDPISPQGIAFRNVKNGRIEGSTISNHYVGILIDRFTQNVSIIGNQISSNWEGLYSESNVTVEGNTFNDNRRGLFLYSGATVRNNDFVSNTHIGIDLSWSAFGGTISENRIEGNGNGGWVGGIVFENNSAHWTVSHNQIRYNNASGIFMVWGPSNITVEYNDISYNVGEGVHFEDARDVTVAHNNFIGNAVPQAYDANGAVNRWDSGCSGGGNYWSDYTGSDNIDCRSGSAGSDGMGDSPYVIDADSQDNYPFMHPLILDNWTYTPHPPILITSNAGFNASNGVTGGSGLPGDPYIIEGWEIDASAGVGIKIWYTDARFTIRNVYVHSNPQVFTGAINLRSAQHGLVENSLVTGSNSGLFIDSCYDIAMAGNVISGNSVGIDSFWSDYVIMTGNNVTSTAGIGIYTGSTNTTVEGNTFSGNGRGLYVDGGATVRNNRFLSNWGTGINLGHASYGGLISGNAINGNGLGSGAGIYIGNTSAQWTISNNRITSNNVSGISVVSPANNITIDHNEISYNLGYGISLAANDILVHSNNFRGNGIQAYDIGANRWDDGCAYGGNYWSDHSGVDAVDCSTGGAGSDGFVDAPYVIDANSQDNYPLMGPLSFNNTPPDVTVVIPDGGEDWTGNTVHDIEWTMYDDYDVNLTVWIYWSTNASWNPIPSAQGIARQVGYNTFSWTLPGIDSTSVRVKVEAEDSNGTWGSDTSDDFFTIDSTLPTVLSTDPPDGATDVLILVPLTINITFSESMNPGSSAGFSISPYVPGSLSWPAPNVLRFYPYQTLSQCTMYTVTQGANATLDGSDPGNSLDGNGNGQEEGSPTDDYSFSFTTQCFGNEPTATVTSPVGGEDWTGGYSKQISWDVSDPQDPPSLLNVSIYYSTDGGQTWILIVTGLSGNDTPYSWQVPFVNTTAAKVKVCATDTSNLTGCGISGAFTIDSTSPQVTSTVPPDGAVDVPLNATLVVTFDEWMDNSSGSVMLIPSITGSIVWPNPTTMYFIPGNLWTGCTVITVGLMGFKDDSDPGNTMGGTYTFSFTTVCPGPPHVALIRPVGGEYWRGGSSQLINWTAFDSETSFKNLTFIVNYSSGVSSGTIVGPVKMLTAYLWTVPSIDAADVRINVTVIDLDSMSGFAESGAFTIDSTPPSLSSHIPTGWNVPVDSSVSVTFSEPVVAIMNRTDLAIALRDGGTGQWVPASRAPSGFTGFMQLVPGQPLKQCTAYEAFVNDTFIDRALWTLTNPASWTFHTVCPPSLSFQTAVAGKDWTGGSSHSLAWTMGDEIDTQLKVWINYSRNDGVDGYPYAAYSGARPTGANAYAWTLPLIDTEKARIKITVADSSGMVASAITANFTIDSTPPSILSSVPSGGSHGIKITDVIQVVFTEAIVRTSAEQSFSLSPNPGGLGFSWQRTTLGKDIMIVDHKPLSQKTDYTMTFSTTMRDDSDPGNHPASALTIQFSTKPPPPVNPPVAMAVGQNQIAVGEETTFDGSQSTGNITKYVWTITDNQDNIVEVLEGKVVNYTFSQNGRYRVTLRVIDEPSGVWDEDYIEINVTSSVNAGAIILLSSALIIAAAVGGTEVGRVALFMLLAVPVYKRKMKGKDDVETRGMVIGYVRVHPGDTFTDIKTNLGLHNGSATWHLMKLEKDGIIKSQIRGSRRLYFPANMPLPFEDGGDLHEIEKRMLHMVKSDPGMTVKVLAEELGVSSQLALYHMRKLSQKGLVSLERRGLRLKAYPPSKRAT